MIKLTPQIWTSLRDINTYRNDNIHYIKDAEHYGKSDYWAFPDDDQGDCEDYSIAKQWDIKHQLDFFASLATCWVHPSKPAGQQGYHAVLLVDTDYGTYVLDNRFPSVFHFEDCNYKWHKREEEDETWVKIVT
jgi:predicted transglutaminase-like cysteine proteinase